MADVAIKKINSPDFNPEKFVKELSQRCVGGQELQQQRLKIQALADETNISLKKNVYQNYMQFIETAKEISHLESEMYQLSHLLTEQRSLLDNLASASLFGEKLPTLLDSDSSSGNGTSAEDEAEQRRSKLAAILEKVEGCISLLDVPGRWVLHEGDLVELDPLENTAIQRVHAYLLTDGLMITTWNSNSRGPSRYKFNTMYELGTLAVVNVRDLGNVKMAFKVLHVMDTRVFQCSSSQSKEEWLNKFEEAKKLRKAQEQHKRESASTLERSPLKSVRSESLDSSYNPFDESEEDVPEVEIPEWLLEAPEDLDVCIAQRHFEDAYTLLEKAKNFIKENIPTTCMDPIAIDIRQKIDERGKALTAALTKELEVSPDKSLQGGLRAARRAVRLLNLLDRSTQACSLFLRLCSSIMKVQLKRVKREGATVLYVRQLGGIFFSNLMDMTREFLRAFPNSPSCTPAFMVWASSELAQLTSHLIRQVFMPQSPISTLAECVSSIRNQCDQLVELGLDLRYQLDGQLRSPLTRALHDAREKLVEAVKLRAAEDKWRPMNLQSKAGLQKCLQEMSDIGIASIHAYVTGECWVSLTSNTIAFCKLYLSLLEDCLHLATFELLYTIDEVLGDVFQAQMKHVEISIRSDKLKSEKQFIQKNAAFLLDTLLTLSEHCYEEKIGQPCSRLTKIRDEYNWLKKDGLQHSLSTRSIGKFTKPEFV